MSGQWKIKIRPTPRTERVQSAALTSIRNAWNTSFSVTVENKFGVLSRIAGLFSGRGFNIESLSVAPTLDPSMSQMTIVTSGDERIVEQIVKQLNKLIDVIKVVDLNESDFVSRETALDQGAYQAEDRAEALADRRYFPRQRH